MVLVKDLKHIAEATETPGFSGVWKSPGVSLSLENEFLPQLKIGDRERVRSISLINVTEQGIRNLSRSRVTVTL